VKLVFADTVGLLARWDRADQWHPAATSAFTKLMKLRTRVVTTTFVLLECGNAAARRPYRQRVNELRRAWQRARLLIEPSNEELEQAWGEFARGTANQAGIVDQISFVVMRRLGITQAFTNDEHFRAAGFETLF
jgi:predicted nucleic acid-binding protein